MSAADNLIANSSSELDNNSDNWPDNWTQMIESGKTASFAWSSTAKYGNKSISISNPTGWAVASSDYIPATASDKFITLSGWSKQINSNTTGNYLMQVAIHYTNGTTSWLGNNFSRVEDDWQHVAAAIEPTGNIISERFSNGTYTAYEYDGSNRLSAIKNYNAAGAVLDSYSYTYDVNGNRTSVITPSGTINYQYD